MQLEQFSTMNVAYAPARVLVVDDDPLIRRVMVSMLSATELTTEVASSGREALAMLDRGYDVIVTDVDMPDGDGLELLRAVRRIDLDVPVIMMTGKPDVSSAARALEYGAFRYLTKPIKFEQLVAAVRLAVRGHQLARLRREASSATGVDVPRASDLAGLDVRLSAAIDQLWLAFQPILGARSGALFGVEALVRSHEPSMATPGALLEAAAQLDRLTELGRVIRARAAAALADSPGNVFLFVNLHPQELLDDELVDPRSPLAGIASRVVLEITERATLKSTTEMRARLEALRALGFRFAIDDLGAGYAGLTSFADVIPEVVKLDMSLVRGVHASDIRQRTIRAVSDLSHSIGGLLVAEGVETVEERDCLRELGCDLFQGFLFARPSPELPRWRSTETLAQLTRIPAPEPETSGD